MPTSNYATGGWVPYSTSATYTTYTTSRGWYDVTIPTSNEPGWPNWNQKDWQVIQDFIAWHNKQKSDPEEQDIVDLLD